MGHPEYGPQHGHRRRRPAAGPARRPVRRRETADPPVAHRSRAGEGRRVGPRHLPGPRPAVVPRARPGRAGARSFPAGYGGQDDDGAAIAGFQTRSPADCGPWSRRAPTRCARCRPARTTPSPLLAPTSSGWCTSSSPTRSSSPACRCSSTYATWRPCRQSSVTAPGGSSKGSCPRTPARNCRSRSARCAPTCVRRLPLVEGFGIPDALLRAPTAIEAQAGGAGTD